MDRVDHSHLRRLRFDLDGREDESVPGAIARGVAGHHLRLSVVLKEAGAKRHAGLTQLADPATLTRIGHIVRTDAGHLIAQAGRRLVAPGDRRLQHFVDFSGLVMPRSHLDLRRRRISPLALLDGDHHRQAWLIAVLPFCPDTLERLIDTCPLCGFKLGWVTSAGIPKCENCFKTIPPTTRPALATELAEDYRLFAGLLSLQPMRRSNSVTAMPGRLQDLTSGELARLAMRCGLDCVDGEGKRAWQTRVPRGPPERIAETAARGIALLRSWPQGISAWAEDRLERALDEKACRRDLQYRIRRIAWGDSAFSDQRALLTEVFPNLTPAISCNSDADTFYTGRQAGRRLPGFSACATELRRLKIVPYRSVPDGGGYGPYHYSAPVIDAAADRMADAMSVSSIMRELKLPRYAIEQMFAADLLTSCDDPILALLLRRQMAVASRFDDFVRNLRARQSRRTTPVNALPIGHESHRLGGSAKPWSDIYEALLSGRLPFWLDGGITTKRLLVAPGSLDEFLTLAPRRVECSVPDMSTMDAAELLNVIPGAIRALRSATVLPHAKGPRALTTPREDIQRLAAKYVSAAEMARRTRRSAEYVNEQLRLFGAQSFHGLWSETRLSAPCL